MPNAHLPRKACVACGREIVWRKKWQRDWEGVKFCSDECRKGPDGWDKALEEAILTLLSGRRAGATICPSEAARAVFGEEHWRGRMEDARRAARRLVAAGRAEITQGGRAVDPSRARGAIRVRLK